MCAGFLGPIDKGITDLFESAAESSFARHANIVPRAEPALPDANHGSTQRSTSIRARSWRSIPNNLGPGPFDSPATTATLLGCVARSQARLNPAWTQEAARITILRTEAAEIAYSIHRAITAKQELLRRCEECVNDESLPAIDAKLQRLD
jgi:hypothetical protein